MKWVTTSWTDSTNYAKEKWALSDGCCNEGLTGVADPGALVRSGSGS